MRLWIPCFGNGWRKSIEAPRMPIGRWRKVLSRMHGGSDSRKPQGWTMPKDRLSRKTFDSKLSRKTKGMHTLPDRVVREVPIRWFPRGLRKTFQTKENPKGRFGNALVVAKGPGSPCPVNLPQQKPRPPKVGKQVPTGLLGQ